MKCQVYTTNFSI